jgi:hypothetical protein
VGKLRSIGGKAGEDLKKELSKNISDETNQE